MGGYGSGRSGGGPTIEDGLTLDLGKLMRDHLFQPGQACGGSIVWTNTRTGEQISSIGYQAQLSEEHGRVRLHYTTTRRNGEKHASDYWVGLETTPQPFGGRRWWFVCPRTGACVAKLYLRPGALTFASRQAHRLAYRSQRETPRDRALGQAFNLRRRLGNNDRIGGVIAKPKGMRWRTFDSAVERIDAIENQALAHTWALLKRIS